MIVSLIVAYDRARGIGRNGQLPWRIPADLRLFKRLTWGHHIVMGRRTWESIGRPLPGRTSIVVARSQIVVPPECFVVPSLDEALAVAQQRGETECFVIGGGMLYREALQRADRIYASEVKGEFECDTFFPALEPTEWVERAAIEFPASDATTPAFRFRVLDRVGTDLPLPAIATESADPR